MYRKYYFSLALLAALVSATAFVWFSVIRIETKYISTEVWLDGKYVGSTPYTMFIFDANLHNLELRSPETLPVRYAFHRASMPKFLVVNPFLGQDQSSIAKGIGWMVREFVDGVYLVDLLNANRRLINKFPQPIDDKWHIFDNKPYGIPIQIPVSSDGAYVLDNTDAAFWLIPVENPNAPVEIFHEYAGQILENRHEKSILDMGFSPLDKWIWVEGEGFFSVASIHDPQTPVLRFRDSIFVWSSDAEWLAVYDYQEDTPLQVFHFENNAWRLYAELSNDRPCAFWGKNPYLLVFNKRYNYVDGKLISIEHHPPRLVDVQNGEIIATIETKNPIGQISKPAESPNGKLLAFTYTSSIANDINRGDMMIINKDGEIKLIISDEDDYSYEPDWLPNSRQIAVLVQYPQRYIKIVDVNDN